ncbi:MAG: XrtA system polysaccharide deacetylase [Gemmataceae bacterium]
MTNILSFTAPTDHTAEQQDADRGSRVINALTIDVEDYYHVSGFESVIDRRSWDRFESRVVASTEKILALLDDAGVHGTFFVLGWVAERHPRLVRAIHAGGHEIGSHSYAHRLIYQQTPAEFRADLRRSLAILEDITGEPVTAYRAPSFSVTADSLWALDILAEEGIRLDSSIYPTHHDRYGIAGSPLTPHRIETTAGPLWEFPPPVCRLLGYPLPVGGGGYFRLYPYPLTRFGLRQINAERRPFSAYFHPWEFDPDQPRIGAAWSRRFRHYVSLRHTEGRLARLLRDFAFGTLSEALTSYLPEAADTLAPPVPARRAA